MIKKVLQLSRGRNPSRSSVQGSSQIIFIDDQQRRQAVLYIDSKGVRHANECIIINHERQVIINFFTKRNLEWRASSQSEKPALRKLVHTARSTLASARVGDRARCLDRDIGRVRHGVGFQQMKRPRFNSLRALRSLHHQVFYRFNPKSPCR